MQEDGLPLMNVNYGTDNYLRADIMTERLEAVRGGTASILGANALVVFLIMFQKQVEIPFKVK
jgi:hypothetical protein